MSADSNFNIAVTVDKTEVASGFESVQNDAQGFVESINVQADKLGGSYAKAFAAISEESKAAAASVTADQVNIAQATRAVSVAQRENSAALKLVKSDWGDAATNAKLYAATLSNVSQAQATLKALNTPLDLDATSAKPDPNQVVSSAAQVDTSEIAKREAAAEIELAAAKLARKEVQDALAQSDADEATQQAALAAVNEDVAEKEAALTAIKAERVAVSKESEKALADEAEAEAARGQAAQQSAELASAADQKKSVASQRAAVALLENSAAQKGLKEAIDLASNSALTESERVALLAPALDRAAVASTELSLAQEKLAGASHEAVSGVQATSGAIRSLEGNGGIRAVENFISKTLGLGPAMQAIFPLVGAAAFLEILFKTGEKIVDVYEKAQEAASRINRAAEEQHEKAQIKLDDLDLENAKLQEQLDKLSGTPGNGLDVALATAKKQADELRESLSAARKEEEKLFKENRIGAIISFFTGKTATGDTEKDILAAGDRVQSALSQADAVYSRDLAAANGDAEKIKAAGEKRGQARTAAIDPEIAALQKRAAALKKGDEDSEKQAEDAANSGEGSVGLATTDSSAAIGEINKKVDALQNLKAAEADVDKQADLRTKVGAKQQENAGAKDSDKEQQALLRSIEQGLADRQAIREREPAEVAAYLAEYLTTFKKGSSEAISLEREFTRALNEAQQQRFKEALKGGNPDAVDYAKTRAQRDEALEAQKRDEEEGEAALRKGASAVGKWAKETAEDILRTGKQWQEYNREVTKGSEIAAQLNADAEMARGRALEAVGGISKLGLAQAEAAAHAKEYAAELKVLTKALADAEEIAAKSVNPANGNTVDPKAAAEVEKLKNQIAQKTGQGGVQAITDKSNIQTEITAPYLRAFNSVEQGFSTLTSNLLKGNKTVAQSFKELASGLAMNAIQAFEKTLFTAIQHEALTVAAHHAANTEKAESDQIAATESKAIKQRSAIQEIFFDAKSAAAATFKSVAAIPIIGPVLAPEAAAGAFAGVMALAAFEQGTPMVPRDGIAMLHKGEAVLDSPSAGAMREMLGGGGSRSPREMHLHLGGNQFSSANGDFKSQFSQHEGHVISSIKKWQRDGKL